MGASPSRRVMERSRHPAPSTCELDCGQMTVGVAPGNAWHVAGSDDDGRGPTIDSTDASLSVRSRPGNGAPFFGFGARDTWQVTVPDDPRSGHGSPGQRRERDGRPRRRVTRRRSISSRTPDRPPWTSGTVKAIGGLQARLNAGSLGLTLPNTSLSGTIVANAGTVRLCAPPGAALKLRTGENIVGELRLRRAWPGQGRFDVDDAGFRHRRREDRAADVGQRGFLYPRSGGWLWLTGSIDRATTGC